MASWWGGYLAPQHRASEMLGAGLPRSNAKGVHTPAGTNTDDVMRNPVFVYQSEGGTSDIGKTGNRQMLHVQRGRYRTNTWAGLFTMDEKASDPPYVLGVRDDVLVRRD
jgi:hypothetical protein